MYNHVPRVWMYTTVLVRITIVVIKPMPKATWGEKGLFGLYCHCSVRHQRESGQELKQDRILEAGTDAEATEAYCLLACSTLPVQSAFL